MTDALYALIPQYGAWVVFAVTLLSCLALPIPASLVMLAAGAFAAAGDLDAARVAGAALIGATLGDQLGFFAGRAGGPWLLRKAAGRPRTARLLGRAEARLAARAGTTIFFSRWLVSALGPYVNLAAGAARVEWRRFTWPAVLGETVWVGLYVGLGFVFAARVEAVGSTVSNVIGALGAAAVAVVLGRVIWRWRAGLARN